MRKSLVALTLLVATVFGVGYVIGQIRGVTPSSAASSRQTTQPPDGPRHAWGPHAAGQVTAINGNTVTIKPLANRPADQGASVTTVILAGTTQYATGPGRAAPTSATRDAVKVGSYIVAIGTLSSDGKTLTASRVMVLPSAPTGPGPFGQGPWHGPGPHADGQVTAINGNTVTIKPNADRPGDTASSVTTVVLTSTTQYGAPHDSTATATRDSVKVGSFLIAEGTLSSDGKTLTASRVLVLPSLPASGTPHGAFPDWHANA